uniref:Uncharacterized protein n=1 Tax=Physcomitrium patens TaxID=3218 RepID=A0A7I4CTU3_PHYPA
MDFKSMDVRTLTLLGAGMCTIASMHFTSQLVGQHLFYWNNRAQQKLIIIIILMAPIYAVTSFFGLAQIQGSEIFFTFLESIKECYEALVIASFLNLMYEYVGISTSKRVVPDEIKGRAIHHSFPMTLFVSKEEKCDVKSLKRLQDWTWQFVILRPLLSVLVIFLEWMGLYEGLISWTVTLVLNVSVSLAMYSLVVFYHLFHAELAPHNPLAKILCIKGVVFFSFWQVKFLDPFTNYRDIVSFGLACTSLSYCYYVCIYSVMDKCLIFNTRLLFIFQGVALQLLAAAGIIRAEHIWLEINQIEEAYQNIFVCVEMVGFAILQQYAFSVQEYSGNYDKILQDAQRRREKKD